MSEIRSISSVEELDEVIKRSHHKPVWVFKHSLVCGVSSAAWRQFRSFAEAGVTTDEMGGHASTFSLVEIQKAGEVSQAVVDRTGIRHESPQVILLQNAKPIWNTSHWGITTQRLEGAARAAASSDTEDR